MTPEELAILSARLDARIDYWRSCRRRKDPAYVIAEALDAVNRDCRDLCDAIVMAQTARKPRSPRAPA